MRQNKALQPTASNLAPSCLGRLRFWRRRSIFWSAEDEVFVADIPELPGCMAHGTTREEALDNAKAAEHLWLDTAREFGDPIREPKGRRLVFA